MVRPITLYCQLNSWHCLLLFLFLSSPGVGLHCSSFLFFIFTRFGFLGFFLFLLFFFVLHHRIFWFGVALHDRVRMGLDLDLGFQNTYMNGFQNTHSLNTAVGVLVWCPSRDRGWRSCIGSISVDGRRPSPYRFCIGLLSSSSRRRRLRWRWN